MKNTILLLMMVTAALVLSGCATPAISPDRVYNVYNIINGKMPGDAEVLIAEDMVELKGFVLYQRFEVKAETMSTYDQDLKQNQDFKSDISVIP